MTTGKLIAAFLSVERNKIVISILGSTLQQSDLQIFSSGNLVF